MSERSVRIGSAALGISAYVLLLVLDVATESEPVPLSEFLVDALEIALIVASATGVALLTGSFQRERAEKEALRQDLRVALAEGDAWRDRAQRHVAGLSEEIGKQFEEWQLTLAEREVGFLMLKGFNHREIASLRGTTEATVRFQARAIYQKSRMPGRSAFCAFFLEDLLPSRSLGPVDRPPN